MTETHPAHGFLLINKPAGISSHACIAQVKRTVGKKDKIGHAGTLDPFASGLLIVGIGRAYTKQLPLIMAYSKEYVAQGQLNLLTDTLDPTGAVVRTENATISKEQLEDAIASFGNAYEQTPPIYSALKSGGKRLYRVAREGTLSPEELAKITAEKKRVVQLYEMSLIDFAFPHFTIRARVSRGTYIRSLVNDIAGRCNSCATTTSLIRTNSGPFSVNNAANCATVATYWAHNGSWKDAAFFHKNLPS